MSLEDTWVQIDFLFLIGHFTSAKRTDEVP